MDTSEKVHLSKLPAATARYEEVVRLLREAGATLVEQLPGRAFGDRSAAQQVGKEELTVRFGIDDDAEVGPRATIITCFVDVVNTDLMFSGNIDEAEDGTTISESWTLLDLNSEELDAFLDRWSKIAPAFVAHARRTPASYAETMFPWERAKEMLVELARLFLAATAHPDALK